MVLYDFLFLPEPILSKHIEHHHDEGEGAQEDNYPNEDELGCIPCSPIDAADQAAATEEN